MAPQTQPGRDDRTGTSAAQGGCEYSQADGARCGRLPVERARGDDVRALCRKHLMEQDGRMARFLSYSRARLGPQPAKPCINCQRPSKPLRKGKCKTCSEYERQFGVARPYVHDGRSERWTRTRELIEKAQPRGRIRRGGGGGAL